ncbi:MAG: hypothetical protein ACUZ8H_01510 [Candidatus Anammoxibacter sp.]
MYRSPWKNAKIEIDVIHKHDQKYWDDERFYEAYWKSVDLVREHIMVSVCREVTFAKNTTIYRDIIFK